MKRQGSWLLLAASAAVLGACSTTAPRMSTPSPVPGQAADGMKWGFDRGFDSDPQGEVKLAYGEPDTDNVGIMLFCRPKTASVQFVTDLDKGRPGRGVVRFESGKDKGRYAASLEKSEASDGWIATGKIQLPDPVLSAFEKAGQISQVEDKTYPQNARTAAERADIKRFFGACRG